MINKALLTGAFEKLGPERVQRGVTGHRVPNRATAFQECFLAHVWGAPGELRAYLNRSFAGPSAHTVLGLSSEEFQSLWHTVDHHPNEFMALANEWLENRPASLRVIVRETAVVSR